MNKRHLVLAAAASLLFAGWGASAHVTYAADGDAAAKIEAAKIAAKEKFAQSKALIAEKARQASDAAKAAYDKAKAEYDAAQTPEAKATRATKIKAAKLKAMEGLAKAKAIIAEKAQNFADAAKEEYEKLKTEAEKK